MLEGPKRYKINTREPSWHLRACCARCGWPGARAAALGYDDTRSFLEEFYPGNAGRVGADSASQ
jgi:hypothetical protein